MFLNVVHLLEVRCALCTSVLASPGARSFIVDREGNPVHFDAEKPPEQLLVELTCPNGHVTQLSIPEETSVEEAMTTPDEAPIGADAVLVS